jgi:hypothetical protein
VCWLNFEPTEGPSITVTDTEVSGFAWAENIGWINFKNLSIPYKVQTAWVPAVQECPGDFNGDRKVDGLDFITFRNEWGKTGCGEEIECMCDMNDDGKADGLDFIIFMNNWGKICQLSCVKEVIYGFAFFDLVEVSS